MYSEGDGIDYCDLHDHLRRITYLEGDEEEKLTREVLSVFMAGHKTTYHSVEWDK